MSDPGERDPLDDAYVRAETTLDDEATGAERRARVIAAVASAQANVSASRPIRRGLVGAWAAAAVVVLSVGTAVEVQRGAVRLQPAPPPPSPSLASHPSAPSTPPIAPPASADASEAAPKAQPTPVIVARRAAPEEPAPAQALPPPPMDVPAPPPLPIPPSPKPAPLSEAAPIGSLSDAQVQAVRARSSSAPPGRHDAGAGLRDAAAAGRIAEVEALLLQGVPVDAADAKGDTALIKAARSNRPEIVTLLRKRGADADRVNNEGESARTIAADKNDAELSEAFDPRS